MRTILLAAAIWSAAFGAPSFAQSPTCFRQCLTSKLTSSAIEDEEIRSFLTGLKQVIVPEVNFTGQLTQILRAKYLFPFSPMTKCGGVPFNPEEILARVKEIIHRA